MALGTVWPNRHTVSKLVGIIEKTGENCGQSFSLSKFELGIIKTDL